jgi:curved DNA-binding protein CbpA
MTFDPGHYDDGGWKCVFDDDLYARLELDSTADLNAVEEAYRPRFAWWRHKDNLLRGGGHHTPILKECGPHIQQALTRLEEARRRLSEPATRREYDRGRLVQQEAEWRRQLGDVIEIALVDGRIAADERLTIKKIGASHRIPAIFVERVIREASGEQQTKPDREPPTPSAPVSPTSRSHAKSKAFALIGIVIGALGIGSLVVMYAIPNWTARSAVQTAAPKTNMNLTTISGGSKWAGAVDGHRAVLEITGPSTAMISFAGVRETLTVHADESGEIIFQGTVYKRISSGPPKSVSLGIFRGRLSTDLRTIRGTWSDQGRRSGPWVMTRTDLPSDVKDVNPRSDRGVDLAGAARIEHPSSGVANLGGYEAEDAELGGHAGINAAHPGYSGVGYVDGYGLRGGATTTFRVNASASGDYELTLRYANGTSSPRRLNIYVDGALAVCTTLKPLGNWDTWSEKSESVHLDAGINTVAYRDDLADSDSVNIDRIRVRDPQVAAGEPLPPRASTPEIPQEMQPAATPPVVAASPAAAVNRAPVIALTTSAASATPLLQGQAVQFHVHASDPDGDALQYAWRSTAGELRANGQDATLDTRSMLGSAIVTVVVDDAGGHRVESNQAIFVAARQQEIRAVPSPPARSTTPAVLPRSVFQVRHRHLLFDTQLQPTESYCVGTLELLGDQLSFRTQTTRDNRRDNIQLPFAQMKKAELRSDSIHLTTKGKGDWDFYANLRDLQQINALLVSHAAEFAQSR